jgi:biopolymer transport protein ExbD
MNFQRGRTREEPEINLIPMIDVLLVILIFLMVTTSYAKFAELQINLPQAAGEQANNSPNKQIYVAVDSSGQYAINNAHEAFSGVDNFAQALHKAAGSETEPTIIISADAKATHQSVINIMEAARIAGYGRITFTTQNPSK